MKVVILCGGQGTRLREETEFRPKPMVDVGGRPLLWHIQKMYAHYGLNQFVLCLGYKGQMIKEYFLDYEAMNRDFTIRLDRTAPLQFHDDPGETIQSVTLADTGADTMTGGRLKRIERYIDGDTFLATYGDGLSNVNIAELLAFHKSHGKIATLTAVRPPVRFGVLNIGPKSAVERFHEKPVAEGWINSGFFVFHRRVFAYLSGDGCVLEQEPMQALAADGQLAAYRHEGFFYPMDTYREYKALNDMWARGQAPWKVWQT
jgi:glucose-1-phosphate cytidylyltransferase